METNNSKVELTPEERLVRVENSNQDLWERMKRNERLFWLAIILTLIVTGLVLPNALLIKYALGV